MTTCRPWSRCWLSADLLILLTDQRGLYTADPRDDPNRRSLSARWTSSMRTCAPWPAAAAAVWGWGGWRRSCRLRRSRGASGTDVDHRVRARSRSAHALVAGESLGTRFPALDTPLENRKRWVLGRCRQRRARRRRQGRGPRAYAAGAAACSRAGIVAVVGSFERGDTVSIVSRMDRGITARSRAAWSAIASDDLEQIKGRQSDAIELSWVTPTARWLSTGMI